MDNNVVLSLRNVNVIYPSGTHAIKDLSVDIYGNSITSLIGPPGAGKKTLLRSFNLIHEMYQDITKYGDILLRDKSLLQMDEMEVRKKIGMIFSDPTPFPNMSIYENVLAGYTLNRIPLSKEEKDNLVESQLREVGLWDDYKDLLDKKPSIFRKGVQQRICIARTLALNPDVILMDNPIATLSPNCISIVENLIMNLKEDHTIIMIMPLISESARLADYMMYMEKGELIEYNTTSNLLANPSDIRTEKYITGNHSE